MCVPLFHCFGCVIGVLGAYTHGACLCPVVAFDARQVLETVHRERCTALYGVPTMFIAELERPDFADYDLTSLRTGVMAGALCPEPLMRRVMTEMHLPEITIVYGMTESSPGITMTPRDSSVAQRSQTVGPVLPELEVKIVDPATGDVRQAGDRGELCCRGYNVMKGYYNNPEATRAAIDRRLAAHRRRSQPRPGRLLPDHRPHQGHHHPRRREHRAEGDRGSSARAPGGCRRLCLRGGGHVFRGGRRRGGAAGAGRTARPTS